jgi:hypothetical protein
MQHAHDHHINHVAGHDHDHTVVNELICHLPYAIYSVALGLAILSLLSAVVFGHGADPVVVKKGTKILFHCFHFMHIVFAATGTLITFFRFSKNIGKALLVGIISPIIFCMLSDAVLPYIGGRMLGVPMHFHICFLTEWKKVIPFLFVGLINGFVMKDHKNVAQATHGLTSHAVHIFVSSLASMFYLVSHGFTNWYDQIGMVFLLLIVAVVVPCTLSDVVVPMAIAKMGNTREKHPNQ